jgi:serine protease Do
MLMNTRNIWLSLSLAGFAITLAALPGSSAKPPGPDNAATTKIQTKLDELEAGAQEALQNLNDKEAMLANLQEVYSLQSPEDQDMQVVVASGGSWLGVQTHEVNAENVKQLKLPAERGALVGKIIPDSPAAKAGLKENDVITEVNGQRVEGTAQFRRMIREVPAGRSAQLTLFRAGQSQTLAVTLSKMESHDGPEILRGVAPGAFAFRMPEVEEFGDLQDLDISGNFGRGPTRLGIDAEDLTGDFGNYFGAPGGEGVLIRNVFSDSPAAKAGLKAGDVITSVDGNPIRSVSELRQQIKSTNAAGKSFKLGLLRNKSEMSMDVQLPAPPKRDIRQRSERSVL